MSKSNYEKLGASSSKAGLHKALETAGHSDSSGLFASVMPDISADKNFSSFIHCDGAGTKSIVSYLAYKESKDPSVFAGLAQDALVMNLDDIYCIGRPETLILANQIARNAHLIPDEAISALIKGYLEVAENLNQNGIQIEISGGETADCGDVIRTLLVDAVLTGRIKNENIINANNIVPGDVIIGISSTGKANYEDKENSGIASNGLTLARHCILNKSYAEEFPEVVDPDVEKDLVYRGPFKLSDKPNDLGMSIGEALSSPTRTYAPILKKVYDKLGRKVHGTIHQTGGGMTKVLRFGKGNLYIKDNLFDTPPIFKLIQESGEVPWNEMYQVFNMGHRIELYLREEDANDAISVVNQFGLDAKIVGRVEKSETKNNQLKLSSTFGEFTY